MPGVNRLNTPLQLPSKVLKNVAVTRVLQYAYFKTVCSQNNAYVESSLFRTKMHKFSPAAIEILKVFPGQKPPDRYLQGWGGGRGMEGKGRGGDYRVLTSKRRGEEGKEREVSRGKRRGNSRHAEGGRGEVKGPRGSCSKQWRRREFVLTGSPVGHHNL